MLLYFMLCLVLSLVANVLAVNLPIPLIQHAIKLQTGIGAVCSNELDHSLTIWEILGSSNVMAAFGQGNNEMLMGRSDRPISKMACAGIANSSIGPQWLACLVNTDGDVIITRYTSNGWSPFSVSASSGLDCLVTKYEDDSFAVVVGMNTTGALIVFPANSDTLIEQRRVSWISEGTDAPQWQTSIFDTDGFKLVLVDNYQFSQTFVNCSSRSITCQAKDTRARPLSARAGSTNPYNLEVSLPMEPTPGTIIYCSKTFSLTDLFPESFTYDVNATVRGIVINASRDYYIVAATADSLTYTEGAAFLVQISSNCSQTPSIIRVFSLTQLPASSLILSVGSLAISSDRFIWALPLKQPSGATELQIYGSTSIGDYLLPTQLSSADDFNMQSPTPSPSSSLESMKVGSPGSYFELHFMAFLTGVSLLSGIVFLAFANAGFHIYMHGDDMKLARDLKSDAKTLKPEDDIPSKLERIPDPEKAIQLVPSSLTKLSQFFSTPVSTKPQPQVAH